MGSFRFRLQWLLDARQFGTRQRAGDLGSAQAAEDGAATRLRDTVRERATQLEALRNAGAAGPVELDAWEAGRARYSRVRRDEGAAQAALRHAQGQTEAARRAFLDARRQERALGRLRDRRREAWAAEAAQIEQATLDERAGRGRDPP